MKNNTLIRQAALQAAAAKIVASYGIEKLDAIADEIERGQALRKLYRQHRSETGSAYNTARQHIAKACRRARHPKQ